MCKNRKYKLRLDDFECNLLINGMFAFCNMILAKGKPTEDIDELLIKLIDESEK